MSKKIYINGVGCISPQNTFRNDDFLSDISEYESEYLTSIEPEYKQYISPIRLRRMSRIVKMGVSAAFIALDDAGVEIPDAIISGTGWGCLEDTEKFLTSMIDNKEQLLTPTAFIQSTHNTVSAQIALLKKCTGYNFTYTNRGFSFENSMIDAIYLLQEGNAKNILVGGIDEITPNYYNITSKVGWWKKEKTSNLNLLQTNSKGTLAGEGSTFFSVSSKKSDRSYAELKSLTTIYKPTSNEIIDNAVSNAVQNAGLTTSDIDLAILGYSGDSTKDKVYKDISQQSLKSVPRAWFKHLCGEYYVASSFGLWLASQILKSQTIPDAVLLDERDLSKPIQNILLYNHYDESNHSIYLISRC